LDVTTQEQEQEQNSTSRKYLDPKQICWEGEPDIWILQRMKQINVNAGFPAEYLNGIKNYGSATNCGSLPRKKRKYGTAPWHQCWEER
jgi:hypothetical protein